MAAPTDRNRGDAAVHVGDVPAGTSLPAWYPELLDSVSASKENVLAEYALRSMSAPRDVAEWAKTITTSLPADLTSSLPSIQELESELAAAPDDKPPREAT